MKIIVNVNRERINRKKALKRFLRRSSIRPERVRELEIGDKPFIKLSYRKKKRKSSRQQYKPETSK